MSSFTVMQGGLGSTAWVYHRGLLGPSYSVSLLPGWKASPLPKAPTWGPSGWGAWGILGGSICTGGRAAQMGLSGVSG